MGRKGLEENMTEKLFYQDSFLVQFTAKVESCLPKGNVYEVVLDRTAFFPEGGGQYADAGKLGTTEVLHVREKDGVIYHITEFALQEASTVTGVIDWNSRFMKMQQHTGEHIVSGIVCARFGYHNVGFHLGSEDCTMDFDGEISKDELHEIEKLANQATSKNLEVAVSYPDAVMLEKIEYRSKIEIKGQVRLVTIPGYDTCACCAPHVKRTGEINIIKLTNIQRYKGGVRITMLCGSRALVDYCQKQTQVKRISALLSVKEERVAEGVEILKEETANLKIQLAKMQRTLLSYKVKEVDISEEVVCLFEEETEGEGARILMNLVLERGAQTCVVFQTNHNDEIRYVIGSKKTDVRPLAKALNSRFAGRGGGKAEMVQGLLTGTKDEINAWMQDDVKESRNE